jgi:hypothetical protein
MQTIKEKYSKLHPQIKNGDVILFRGERALAKIIQECDSNAYYNHVGIVLKVSGALFIIDSNANGVEPARLSERINKYVDFDVLRPTESEELIELALQGILKKQDVVKIKYDYINGLKAMLNRKFKTRFETHIENYRNICSMFVLPYALELKMVNIPIDMNNLFFPQDYIRYKNKYKIIL